ncbi:MAG: hypothetical protein IJ091_05600 [Oscillospiraceae bacterium]|nr:hypothetical protein [Oscillospiraceae bacterium]
MKTKVNTIGIDDNLDRQRIKKLLLIGFISSIVTGIGDFLLGYADEISGTSFASSIMSGAPDLSDGQMIAGGLLGVFGIFLEGLACFGIYRLMADAAPGYAHVYRAGIFGYIWLAPVGCHLNMAILNMAYKYLYLEDITLAERVAQPLFWAFSLPLWILLAVFWIPMIVVQFKAFAEGKTPYPTSAKWFNLLLGSAPVLILSTLFGGHTALGAAIGTMFLSFGNAFMFGGLLFTIPDQDVFDRFREKYKG